MRRKKIRKIIWEVIFILISLVYIIPVWMVFINSLKTRQEAKKFGLGLPQVFQFSNYAVVFREGGVLRALFNGLLVAGVSSLLIILVTSMAAFYISRSRRKLARFGYYYLLSGIFIPIAMIATYMVLFVLHLTNTYLGLILMFTTYCLPFSIFLYNGFIKMIPRELDEVAVIDGSTPLRLFFQVIFPLLKPATMTVLVINFLNIWNNVETQLFFASSTKWSMPMTLYRFYGVYMSDWHLVFADVIITTLPVLLLYIFAQRNLIDGLVMGAVKG